MCEELAEAFGVWKYSWEFLMRFLAYVLCLFFYRRFWLYGYFYVGVLVSELVLVVSRFGFEFEVGLGVVDRVNFLCVVIRRVLLWGVVGKYR